MAGSNSTATYTVSTDTHGYPWGPLGADFDLGDNTNATATYFKEATHETFAKHIKLCGNHDVYATGKNYGKLQTYRDYDNKVIFFGLDTVDTDQSLETIRVPQDQIDEMQSIVNSLTTGWDIVVLSHIPLFPNPKSVSEWPFHNVAAGNYEKVLDILHGYQKGDVIGCFAGHVHNSLKCYYNGIYMETFNTNGCAEWSPNNCGNQGWYQPQLNTIEIDFNSKMVNGFAYKNIVPREPVADTNGPSTNKYGVNATGQYSMYKGGSSYPKFYQGRYMGYSYNSAKGAASPNNISDAWWFVNGVYFHGIGRYVRYVRFDARGELRYYSTTGHENDDFVEIPNYLSASIVFDTVERPSTEAGYTWFFKNGLFQSVKQSPTFSYKSGSLLGKNGYAITFNSNGVPTGLTHNGSPVTYGAGDNWINVYTMSIYYRGLGDLDTCDTTSNVPQIGITGTFPCDKINLARPTSTGSNWIQDRINLFMRIVGEGNQVYWLYDGKLTDLTDAKVGI